VASVGVVVHVIEANFVHPIIMHQRMQLPPVLTILSVLVMAKLGGINMVVNGFGWHEQPRPPGSQELLDATRHYYDYTLEKFGVDRCMFESNFPVDKQSCSYTVLWNSFKRLTAGFSADEKAKLFHDTAARVYRLNSPA